MQKNVTLKVNCSLDNFMTICSDSSGLVQRMREADIRPRGMRTLNYQDLIIILLTSCYKFLVN